MATLAVVLKGYPRLSETFIAQELKALEGRGFAFGIWSLRAPYDGGRTHPIHDDIQADVHYLPEYLHRAPLRVLRAIRHAARLTGFTRAQRAWLDDLKRDPSRNRLRRFGQACVLACELPPETRFLYAHFLHTPASVTRYAAMMRGLDWAVSAHAKDIWTTPAREKADKLTECTFAVTCTAVGAEHLRALAPPERVSLVYHGLDLSRFPAPPERIAGGRLKLLSVGRLAEKKGYDVLLAALARLPADLDWHLTHIGGGTLAAALAAEAEHLGLSTRIDWQGKQNQTAVIAALRAADLFVLPARIAADGDRDGLPNVLMEAASQALPILASRVAAIPEFLPSPEHGVLVRPEDPEALAEAITALARDPARRAALGQAAHARLVAEFGMHAGIDRLTALLGAALDTPTEAAA
ncbi:MAG: glycosyltransferase family 4 protein [Pseudomonadota bacterium]